MVQDGTLTIEEDNRRWLSARLWVQAILLDGDGATVDHYAERLGELVAGSVEDALTAVKNVILQELTYRRDG